MSCSVLQCLADNFNEALSAFNLPRVDCIQVCVAVSCSELQCIAVCCSELQITSTKRCLHSTYQGLTALKCVGVCCSELQGVAGSCRVLQCVSVCVVVDWILVAYSDRYGSG